MRNYDPFEIELATFRQILDLRALDMPDDIVFQYAERKRLETVTCGRFYDEIDRLGAWLCEKGWRRRTVAVLGENSYPWILSYFAVVMSDNIVVPLDKEQNAEELGKLLKRCGAEAIFCSHTYIDVAEAMQEQGVVSTVVDMRDIPSIIEAETGSLRAMDAEPEPDSVSTIIFTSGTTGEPKGVQLEQRAIVMDALNACRGLWVSGSSVLTLPLHHTFGFTVGVLSAYISGYPIFISKSLRSFMNDLKEFRPHNLVLVPLYVETMYKNIWRLAKEQGRDRRLRRMLKVSNGLRRVGIDVRRRMFRPVLEQFGGALEHIVCGGAFLDQDYIDGLEAMGVQILNGYGITECAPVVAVNRSNRQKRNSVGLPLPGCEVKIIDGEICVRGDNVMAGYFEDEEATVEAMEDGWFKTGDLGYIDEDGFLYITGRKKNLIILSNGKNISAEELEAKLLHIENVEEVVVHGEDNVITAEIYAPDQTGVDDAVARLNRELPSYKRIQRVRYRLSEFEKTTTRKIKRYYHKNEDANTNA